MAKYVEEPKKLCTTCGKIGDCGGTIAKCAGCWEVEHRLPDYVHHKSGNGYRFAIATIFTNDELATIIEGLEYFNLHGENDRFDNLIKKLRPNKTE